MNYRHAFHAGNFADCFKHALLIAILDSLARKASPFFVLDSHAGAGTYDLSSESARRTAEADAGILRLQRNPPPALNRYIGLVNEIGLYPGSPALIQAMLRSDDHLACCELHPEDLQILRRRFRSDPRVEVHLRSGWEALSGLLPPKLRRGLIFIDPPFEAENEFLRLADGLRRGHVRFGHGVFAAWYPIKKMAAVRNFHADLTSSGIRDIVAVELYLRDTSEPSRLNGCGLAVINPPYRFEHEAALIADATLKALGGDEIGSDSCVIRLADE